MLRSFFVFGRFLVFWAIFFLIDRILFLTFFLDQVKESRLRDIFLTFLYSIRLDISMIAYLSILPLLSYSILLFLKNAILPQLAGKIYVYFFIILFTLLNVINLNLYQEWGTKINFRAVDTAVNSPKEVIASGSSSPILLSLVILIGFAAFFIVLANRIMRFRIADRNCTVLKKSVFVTVSFILAGLAVRGGWQLTPANQSMAYFSTNTVLNHAALNTQWNLIHDIVNNKYNEGNPYLYHSEKEARKIVNELFISPTDSSKNILQIRRPNVVLIILESFTAEFVESLNGERGINPEMEKLIKEGILFENIYAAAGRTDKGVVATLSGFPSQAIRSIMKQNSKQEKLPGIAQEFLKAGYSTSFYYGGESEFFNMKSYILSHGYQSLLDQHSFEKKDMNSKWGTFDDKVFSKNVKEMERQRAPFFSTILTLTNHEPFELPGTAKFQGENVENKFRSTAYYTDSCLGAYIREAKKKIWYQNTLFIVLADHGHRLPRTIPEFDPDRYRIPLIMFGDVIRKELRGTRIEKFGNQTDLAATLLRQIGLPADRYRWSKDLLNPQTIEFAFFNWDNGFGYATPEQVISFDNVGKRVIMREKPENTVVEIESLKRGKAFMQIVFQDYLNY